MNTAAVLNHLWQTTAVVGVAALAVLALRRHAARVRFGIWMAASLKFLVPFSALAALGSRLPWPQAAPAMPVAASAAGVHLEPWLVPLAAGGPAPGGGLPWAWILGGIWLAGSLVLAWRRLRQWRRMARLARTAQPWGDEGIPIRLTRAAVEPGVFGIVHPVLLLPAGIREQLTPEQFEAVLEHERCHVRRRDNWWAALHTVVETLFWFHPFVWWLGSRLVAERELACDEAVLSAGGDAAAYAGGLVSVCRHYVQGPVTCVAGVTGGPLQRRVRAILAGGWGRGLGRRGRWLLAGLAAAVLLGPVAAGAMHGQSGPASFAAASIRPAPLPSNAKVRFSESTDPQHFSAENLTLAALLQSAFGVEAHQIVAPAWMQTQRFDIQATTAVPVSKAQMLALLRPFLIRQFQMRISRTTKVLPVYALEAAPEGIKLKAAAATAGDQGNTSRQGLSVHYHGVSTITHFVQLLDQQLDRPVMDRTGLSGTYVFDLTFAPPDGVAPHPTARDTQKINAARALYGDTPSLFSALRAQLGLMLVKTKAPLDVVVINAARRTPAGN